MIDGCGIGGWRNEAKNEEMGIDVPVKNYFEPLKCNLSRSSWTRYCD